MSIDDGQTASYAVRTDVGRIREHNEDSYCVNEALGLYVVADGMGGHASGEIASEIAVTVIEQQIKQGDSLINAIEQAHLAIVQGVKEGLGKAGMGTTVVAILLQADSYTLAWVGDSRAYLWHGGLSQLSKDHSLVQMLLDSKQITEAEARVHPRKNVIYQNLGAMEVEKPQVSIKQGVLYKNQKIILCSDGLTDEVDEQQMSEIIAQASDNEALAGKLVAAAVDNGGKDNVTVIVVSAPDDVAEKPAQDVVSTGIDEDTLEQGE